MIQTLRTNWDYVLKTLNKYSCPCGSGGPMACEDDCPGDTRDRTVIDALKDLIAAVNELEKRT